MITLAIDTATPQVSAALAGPNGVLASFRAAAGRRHGETLAPGLAFLAQAAGTPLGAAELIAADVGPGLFTGLRVGLATVKALASALGVPVAGLTSLEVLAHPHRHSAKVIASVVDARRHEVFWAAYRGAPDGMMALSQPAVADPLTAAAALAALHDDVVAVGDGAVRYADVFTAASDRIQVAGPEWAYPSAEAVLELAPSAGAVRAELLGAVYLRQADVRIGWEQRSA